MTRAKRVLAYVVAVVMVLPMLCSTALAEDATGYTFVVKNDHAGYTYLLYQIFKGTPSKNTAGDTVLSNIEWGNGVKEETKESVYNMFDLTGADRCAEKVAEKVADNANNDVFHTILTGLGSNDGSSLQNPKTLNGPAAYTIKEGSENKQVTGYGTTNLAAGYYLVRNTGIPETTSTDTETHTYSDYIVDVVGGDVMAEPKDASPSSSKKTQDVNDSLGVTPSAAQDSSDYDIGDTVPFTLTATLPTNYENFRSIGYRLIFVDDMSAGLTWDGAATIYFGANDTTGCQITFANKTGSTIEALDESTINVTSSYQNGKVWAYDIINIMNPSNTDLSTEAIDKAKALKSGDVITVKYNATLNANANVGKLGNRNSYRVYYSNDPTVNTHVGSTTPDTNVVFTYKTVFNKVNESNSPLTGADFKLEKFVADQQGAETVGGVKGKWVNVTQLHTGSGAANPKKTGGATGSTFEFAGLDDGVYRLTETTTPAGYNTIDPIQFTITAEHEMQSEEPALKALTGTDGAQFTMTANLDAASLTASVKNKPGVVLPATGGLGTVALVGIGSGLALATFVVLITRRRLRVE